MSWVKVDDKAWSHPKMAALSGNAVRLWLFALCWVAEHGTDGALPRVVLRILGGTKRDVTELVASGLWTENSDGWEIHDYLVYQPSAAETRARREIRAEAGRRGGQAKAKQASAKSLANAKRTLEPRYESDQANLCPEPEPEPEPEPNTPLAPPGGTDDGFGIHSEHPVACPSQVITDVIADQLASHYGVTVAVIRHAEREFKTYWTVGAGTGRSFHRASWIAKFRTRVMELHKRGDLVPPDDDQAVDAVDNAERRRKREAQDAAHKLEAHRKLGLA